MTKEQCPECGGKGVIWPPSETDPIPCRCRVDGKRNIPSKTVAFDRLPLGARFRYAGHPRIYVKLGRGDEQCGLIAVWDEAQLDWPGQQLFSLSDTPSERAVCMVEWLDQQPVETERLHFAPAETDGAAAYKLAIICMQLPQYETDRVLREATDDVLTRFVQKTVAVETSAPLSEAEANEIATHVVQNVCELPGYTSPDDQPDLVMGTVTEMHHATMQAIESFNARRAVKANEQRPQSIHEPCRHGVILAYANCIDCHDEGLRGAVSETDAR